MALAILLVGPTLLGAAPSIPTPTPTPTPTPPPDNTLIFSDGFETGDFSFWSNFGTWLSTTAVARRTSSAIALAGKPFLLLLVAGLAATVALIRQRRPSRKDRDQSSA